MTTVSAIPTPPSILRQTLCAAVESKLQPFPRIDLPTLCTEIGLPPAPDDEQLTKRQYINSRLDKIANQDQVRQVATNFANRHPLGDYGNNATFEIEELLWEARPPKVSRRVRRELASELNNVELFTDPEAFLGVLSGLFDLDPGDIALFDERNSLQWRIQQHVIRNPEDWSVVELFDELGAFACSSQRFRGFIEALAGPAARPDEASQRAFVSVANSVLAPHGFELIETAEVDGYPDFSFVRRGDSGRERPKNLIFASSKKPDLRFRDAVDNDVEIVTGKDEVLVYDEPTRDALLWQDLQAWWSRRQAIEDATLAKQSLYRRLWACLPETSPPQRLLFRTFFQHFGDRVHGLPALIPEVWLHYDPKTIRERGRDAL